MKCNAKLRPNYFSVNVSVLAVVFHGEISKKNFEICQRNITASKETFTEKYLGCNSTLHFTSYLSIALSNILPHSKTIKNSKKLSVFGENNSRLVTNFLETHIF